jgi:hypothetical protein
MLIDRSHKPWAVFSGTLLMILGGWYWWEVSHSINGPSGASIPGLTFGIIGTLFMALAGVLGLRRRFRSWRLGKADTWLRGHLWLGTLTLPLIWLHGGFHHGGLLTSVLMYLLYAVILSGIIGLIIQQAVPTRMTLDVPNETLLRRIPAAIERLAAEAREIVNRYESTAAETKRPRQLETFYNSHVRDYLGRSPDTASDLMLQNAFATVRLQLPANANAAIARLERICVEYRQLNVQRHFNVFLHGWLFVHVPLSMALLVLAAIHIVMALRWSF